MPYSITALDWLRAGLLITGAICQALFAFFPELLGIDQTISRRSNENQTLLVPAGLAFVIWLPLYGGSLAFAIYHAFPAQLRDPLVRQVGWLAVASYWANAIWAVVTPLIGPGWISFLILEAILLPVLIAILIIRRAAPRGWGKNLAFAPIFGLAGWLTIASPVGFSLAALVAGLNPLDLDPATASLGVLAVWLLPAAIMTWAARSLVYGGAIIWGLYFVSVINQARGEDLLAWGALGLAAVIALVAILAKGFGRTRPPHTDYSDNPAPSG